MKPTIAIIGLGNMGGAIYKQLKNVVDRRQIFLCSHKRPSFVDKKTYFSTHVNDVLARADIVIIAVKPQSLTELIQTITVNLSKKLIVSILAGTTIKKLQNLTHAKKIVRAMPNLGSQVGLGVTGWAATSAISASEKKVIKKIFGSLGYHVELKNENMINKLTVISGCGPAYFFYLTELLKNKAQQLGFSKIEAVNITATTLAGAAALLKGSTMNSAEWRAAVTSKRGVTEAAITYLQKKKFDRIFYKALDAGIKRSKELAKLN